MQHRRSPFALPLAATVLAFAGALTTARADETIVLKNGEVLKGKVTERPDGKLEVSQKHGARIIDRADVASYGQEDGKLQSKVAAVDTVWLTDGRVLSGNISISDDTHEVIVANDKGGESRFPRALVKSIHFRDPHRDDETKKGFGESIGPVSTHEEDPEIKWRAQIDASIARLKSPLVKEGDKDWKRARSEILELGPFAVKHLQATIAGIASGDPVLPVLEDALKIATFKSVVPAKVEESFPGICEKLVSKDADERVRAVNEVALAAPDEVAPLLLHLIKNDPAAKVKSVCVGQLSVLKRWEELGQVLKMQEHGQWRLAAALYLGDAGIYVGIPVVIEALKLDGPTFGNIRTQAIEALKRWTHQGNLGYLPDSDDRHDRETAVARWESWWKAEGELMAIQSTKQLDPANIPEEAKARALDHWREGQKTLQELDKKQEEARKKEAPIDAKDVAYAYESAAYYFKKALDADPTLSTARLLRAIILYQELGRPREAEGELTLILNRFAPADAKYLRVLTATHLAKIAELERQWKRAEIQWIQVRQLDPLNVDAPVGLGDSYFERAVARPETAKDKEPVEKDPDPAKQAEKEKAQAEKDKAAENAERDGRADMLLRAIRNYRDALDVVDKRQRQLVASASDLSPTGEVGDFREGRLLTTIREDKNSLVKRAADVYFRLGRTQSARGDDGEALLAYRAARRLVPEDERFRKAVDQWEQIEEERRQRDERLEKERLEKEKNEKPDKDRVP